MGVLVFQLTLLTKKKNRYKIGFGPWVIVCWLLFLWTSLVSILHLSTPVVIFPSQKGMASCKHIKWVHSFVFFFCRFPHSLLFYLLSDWCFVSTATLHLLRPEPMLRASVGDTSWHSYSLNPQSVNIVLVSGPLMYQFMLYSVHKWKNHLCLT